MEMARPCASNAKTTSLCDSFNMETGRKKELLEDMAGGEHWMG